jgi:ribosomal protein S18 acetylase RimI-like enzyme
MSSTEQRSPTRRARLELPFAYMDTIRMATIEDSRELASMHVASWRETYAGILPDAMLSALSVEGREAMWDRILRDPEKADSTVVHLVEHQRKVVGFGSCGSQRSETLKDKGYHGEIGAIYVLRAFQRQGVGARLMSSMALDLASRGFNAASLWVLRENTAARAFYERFGGQVVDEREDVRGETTLVEVAYGWASLKTFEVSGEPFSHRVTRTPHS